MSHWSRRDFLKLLAASSAGLAASGAQPALRALASGKKPPNILVLVFDAMAARHLSLYGYARNTTPNLARFAEHAHVYHSHYSPASFTSPGTASLLSGLYPWNHRAINLSGRVSRNVTGHNLFRLVGDDYYRVAFTQNLWADLLLRQYEDDLDLHLPASSFSLRSMRPLISATEKTDPLVKYYAFDEFLSFDLKLLNPMPGSLFLGGLSLFNERLSHRLQEASDAYPLGMPSNALFYYFENAQVFAGIGAAIRKAAVGKRPFLGYFHLFSPHGPYCPAKEFVNIFPELVIPYKLLHPLAILDTPQDKLLRFRQHYDEYIANVDAEFGRLMDSLEASGILDNTYVVITSDHGEVFERGEFGHGTYLLYEPVLRIPLLISAPRQSLPLHIHTPTSSLDLLPTLLHIAGRPPAAYPDGRLLPGFGGPWDPKRSIFALEAKRNSAFGRLETATISLVRENRKIIYYTGYEEYPDTYEIYDLEGDVEELHDLAGIGTSVENQLREELLDRLAEINRPFDSSQGRSSRVWPA